MLGEVDPVAAFDLLATGVPAAALLIAAFIAKTAVMDKASCRPERTVVDVVMGLSPEAL